MPCVLCCWQSEVFRDIIPKRYYPIILFIEDRINGEIFLIGKVRIRFQWFFRPFNERMPLSRRFWAIVAVNKGFLEPLRLLPSIFLTILNIVETEEGFFDGF